ncbi:MAG TPA: transketolase [Bacillota bacterium]
MDYQELKKINNQIRVDIINMLAHSKSGHPGGSLSCVEIISTLYYRVMKVDPANPQWNERDRFVLSKGHAAPTLYAVLASRGFFPKDELYTLRKYGSRLQGHPDSKKTPGVDASTGSLGQGSSVAVGMALGAKHQKLGFRVFALLGDGEMQEGQVWEASMAAAHYKLDNLTFILDYNGLQIDGSNEQVMSLGDISGKMRAYGFKVIQVDGHDVTALEEAFQAPCVGQPKFVIAKTTKGKGVSFMEGQVGWHGKAPNDAEINQALKELGGTRK